MFLTNKIKSESIDILPTFTDSFDFSTIRTSLQKMLRDIMAILTLRKGSVVYNIEKGGSLAEYIFDNITKGTIEQIKTEIKHNLESSLFIQINHIEIIEDKKDKRVLHINLSINIDDNTDFKIAIMLNDTGVMDIVSASEVISKVIIN